MVVLVTGFKPWGSHSLNPSGQIASRLDDAEIRGEKVVGVELKVSYREVREKLPALILSLKPSVALHLGLAPETPSIRVERVAVNIIDAGPDADKAEKRDEPVVEGAPAAYFATLPTRTIVEELRRAGIPTTLSYTAGTYLCNYAMYLSLHTVAENKLPTLAGFLHIPYTPEMVLDKNKPSMPLTMAEKAVKIAIETSLETLRQSPGRL